jgi:hypothetical protein
MDDEIGTIVVYVISTLRDEAVNKFIIRLSILACIDSFHINIIYIQKGVRVEQEEIPAKRVP